MAAGRQRIRAAHLLACITHTFFVGDTPAWVGPAAEEACHAGVTVLGGPSRAGPHLRRRGGQIDGSTRQRPPIVPDIGYERTLSCRRVEPLG